MFTKEVIDDYLKVVMDDISNAINKPTAYNSKRRTLVHKNQVTNNTADEKERLEC